MKHRSRSLAVVGAVVLACGIVATSAGAAKPTETWTVVEHDVTLPPEFFPAEPMEAHLKQIFLKLRINPAPETNRRVLAVLAYLRSTSPAL